EDADLVAIKADVTSVEEVDAAFAAVEERWGAVEVLVANAGITQDGLLLHMGNAGFGDFIDTNLNGAYRCAKRAAGPMVRARAGRMIFVSSVAGLAVSA